jgi:hypothetical protein
MSFRAVALYLVVWSAIVAAACAELKKSENPLTPTVAGPIPGVNITMPLPLEPKDGVGIAVGNQPLTLVLQNAQTTGVRPISYAFEVATTDSFATKVFSREGVTPGENGRTSLRLPEALGSGRTYYWRAMAQDGANTGPYSGVAHFNIFTPIVIGAGVPIAPVNNAMLSSLAATFVIGNAPRSGPVGPISYVIEVSDYPTLSPLKAQWVVGEQPNQTRFNAPGLPQNDTYFWRVRAYDGNASGPWSEIARFRTPLIQAPTPAPGAGGTGGTCSGQPLTILNCRRNQYGPHMSDSQVVDFLRNSARDINKAGTGGGGTWGLLVKDSGSNCNGYSCDILCQGNGSGQVQRDVLLDSDGSQLPIWGDPMSGSNIVVRPCQAP